MLLLVHKEHCPLENMLAAGDHQQLRDVIVSCMQLGIEFAVRFEGSHVVNLQEQVWVAALPRPHGGQPLTVSSCKAAIVSVRMDCYMTGICGSALATPAFKNARKGCG